MRLATSLLILSILPISANAGFVGGFKAETGVWQTKIDGNAHGIAAGPNVAYAHDRYFGAMGFTIGNYFGDNDATFGRNELDISLGYRILPNISGFLAFKQSYISYDSTPTELSFSDTISTTGGGIAFSYPVTHELIAIGTLSMDYSIDNYKSSQQNVSGKGLGNTGEIGLSYRVAKRTSVNARMKGQATVLNYDETQTSWNTRIWKLGLDVVHAF
ncbi:MAG: porin family protein [Gammaproteobacteria bacterium]|nr:porin family protein [Gammaproteobacteria bacterium]